EKRLLVADTDPQGEITVMHTQEPECEIDFTRKESEMPNFPDDPATRFGGDDLVNLLPGFTDLFLAELLKSGVAAGKIEPSIADRSQVQYSTVIVQYVAMLSHLAFQSTRHLIARRSVPSRIDPVGMRRARCH